MQLSPSPFPHTHNDIHHVTWVLSGVHGVTWLLSGVLQGSTAVTFTIPRAPSSCTAEQTSLTLTVQVGCPTSKTFKLVYPVS